VDIQKSSLNNYKSHQNTFEKNITKYKKWQPGDCSCASTCRNLRAFSDVLFFPVYNMDSLGTAASFIAGFAVSFWEYTQSGI
jgi:hypothetical protein